MRRVGSAEHFHPELELNALGDGKVAIDADIQVEETRSPNGVASHRAEADFTRRNGAECSVIEVMTRRVGGGAGSARLSEHLRGADAASDAKWPDLIRCLGISRSVDLSPSASERERRPAHPLHQPTECPSADHLARDPARRKLLAFPERQFVRSVD